MRLTDPSIRNVATSDGNKGALREHGARHSHPGRFGSGAFGRQDHATHWLPYELAGTSRRLESIRRPRTFENNEFVKPIDGAGCGFPSAIRRDLPLPPQDAYP